MDQCADGIWCGRLPTEQNRAYGYGGLRHRNRRHTHPHLGDNRPDPGEAFWKAIGKIDVLILPVDGSQHILSYEQGNAIVDRLKPKVVIATHYLNEFTTYTLSTLQSADEWVKAQKRFQMLDSPTLKLASAELADMSQEFMYFGSHVQTT